MSNKTLIIMRGLPGSGKSTRAKEFGGKIFSADDFFMKDNKYQFDVKLIGVAHKWNQDRVTAAAKSGEEIIVVDNTNTTKKEIAPYYEIACSFGYDVKFAESSSKWWSMFKPTMTTKDKNKLVKTLLSKNIHKVPEEVILKMIDRWEWDVDKKSMDKYVSEK